MNLTQTKTSLVDLLSKRMDVWDTIDRAYQAGMINRVIELERYVDDYLTPQIRKEYNL